MFSDNNNVFSSPYYDFNNLSLYEDMRFNLAPKFLDPAQNLLQIPLNSPAAFAASAAGNLNTDITGALRPVPADLGAYNAIDFEN